MSAPAEIDGLLAGASGYGVVTSGGSKVGTAESVRYEHDFHPSHLLIIRRGRFLRRRRVIPLDAVEQVLSERREVRLRISARTIRHLPRSPFRLDERKAIRYSLWAVPIGALAGGALGWGVARLDGLLLGLATGWSAGGGLGLVVAGGLAGHVRRDTGRGIGDEIAGDMVVAVQTYGGGIAGLYLGDTYGELVGLSIGFAVGHVSAPRLVDLLASFKKGLPDPYAMPPPFERRLRLGAPVVAFLLAAVVYSWVGPYIGLSAGERLVAALLTVANGLGFIYGLASLSPRVHLERARIPSQVLVYPWRTSRIGAELCLFKENDSWEGIRQTHGWGERGEETATFILQSAIDSDVQGRVDALLYRYRLKPPPQPSLLFEEVFAGEVPTEFEPPPKDVGVHHWYALAEAQELLPWPENRDPQAIATLLQRRSEGL